MVDKPKSPFSGLDKALLRSTRVKEPLPADQQGSQLVSQPASTPADQQGSQLVSQPTSTPVDQPASIPVNQQAGARAPQLVKATFYLTDDHIMQLEQLRLERKRRGEKIDKSALVREAIEQLTAKPANQ